MYAINYMKFIQDENAEEESKEEEPKSAEEESWEESFHEHKDSRPKGFYSVLCLKIVHVRGWLYR